MTWLDKAALYMCFGILMFGLVPNEANQRESHFKELTIKQESRILHLETELAKIRGEFDSYKGSCSELGMRVHVLEGKYIKLLETFLPKGKGIE